MIATLQKEAAVLRGGASRHKAAASSVDEAALKAATAAAQLQVGGRPLGQSVWGGLRGSGAAGREHWGGQRGSGLQVGGTGMVCLGWAEEKPCHM